MALQELSDHNETSLLTDAVSVFSESWVEMTEVALLF